MPAVPLEAVMSFRKQTRGLLTWTVRDMSDALKISQDESRQIGAILALQGYVKQCAEDGVWMTTINGEAVSDSKPPQKAQAKSLRQRFEQAFWCEDLSTYALALDGKKRPCRVRASNAGHCLLTGIAGMERARRVGQTLMGEDFFSSWGIRTLSSREVRFSAMSYHNGSVWPHDNALIARGFSRYGLRQGALKILTGLLDASLFLDLHRLPELFCGFDRRAGQGPTLYPVACSPQSWAAAAVFLILQACLGIRVHASPARVLFRRTVLPESLPRIEIRNLAVGDANADLVIEKEGEGFYVRMLRKQGALDIISIK